MSEQALKITQKVWGRIKRAVLKTEQPEAPAPLVTQTGRVLPPPIRAVLCQRLEGHGHALALRTKRVESHVLQEVSLLRAGFSDVMENRGWFTLSYDGRESLRIDLLATDEEFLEALAPWGLAPGDLYVYGGALTPDEVPLTLSHRPVANQPMLTWTIAFVGPRFEREEPHSIRAVTQPGDFQSIVIAFPSAWEIYGEPVRVFEGGLLRGLHNDSGSGTYGTYQFGVTGYHPGTVVLCVWMPDAEGYVVYAAENKQIEDLTEIWAGWVRAHAWAEFITDAASVAPVGSDTVLQVTDTTIETGWGWGSGWAWGGGYGGWGGGYGGWGGNAGYSWGPFVGRRVLLRSSGTLPTPLQPDTVYYLGSYGHLFRRFQLQATDSNANPIHITSAGTGTHEIWLYGEMPPLPG